MLLPLALALCAASPGVTAPVVPPLRLAQRSQGVASEQASPLPAPSSSSMPMVSPSQPTGTFAVQAPVAPVPTAAPVGGGPVAGEYGPSMAGPGGDCGCPAYGPCCPLLHALCGHCDPATHLRCRAAWDLNPGDMYPWAPYYPEYHGDYYFRPYHWTQVFEQQALSARWGADPRTPYASPMFEAIYAELGIPDVSWPERVRPAGGAKKRPCDYFETVDCKRDYSR